MARVAFHPAGWPVTHPTVRFWRRVVERVSRRLAAASLSEAPRLTARLQRARAALEAAEAQHPDLRAAGPLPLPRALGRS